MAGGSDEILLFASIKVVNNLNDFIIEGTTFILLYVKSSVFMSGLFQRILGKPPKFISDHLTIGGSRTGVSSSKDNLFPYKKILI